MSEKKGILGGLFGKKEKNDCCNMEIVEESKEKGSCCDMQIVEETEEGSCCNEEKPEEKADCCRK